MSPSTLDPLDLALQALKDYAPGSSRGDLLPLDEAVRASLDDPQRRDALEDRLVGALADASVPGQSFILKKLGWIGSGRVAGTIADRLAHPALADEACRALAALPWPEAAATLRHRLPQLTGLARVGAIQVLGDKRDEESHPLLAELMSNGDIETAAAAAGALGRIGSLSAGRALAGYFSRAPGALRPRLTHAVRECADRLARAGHTEAAAELRRLLG